jgi:hypothetical protein
VKVEGISLVVKILYNLVEELVRQDVFVMAWDVEKCGGVCAFWKVEWILWLELRLNCVLCVHQGRVSSDTYLAPQYDPTKTPRIEGMCLLAWFYTG